MRNLLLLLLNPMKIRQQLFGGFLITDKQTDKRPVKHNLLGGGSKVSTCK